MRRLQQDLRKEEGGSERFFRREHKDRHRFQGYQQGGENVIRFRPGSANSYMAHTAIESG
jgi:hypothetical protein